MKPRTLSLVAVAALALTGCASSTDRASTSQSSSNSPISSVDDLIRMYIIHGGECKNREKTLRTDDSEFTMCNDRLRFQVYPHGEVADSELTANADVGNYILYRDNWMILSTKKQLVDEAETHVDAIRHPDPEKRHTASSSSSPSPSPSPFTTFTPTEKKALEAAGLDPNSEASSSMLELMHQSCESPRLGYTSKDVPWSESQRKGVEADLILCPDHPDRAEIEAEMKGGEETDAKKSQGLIIEPGTHKVGDQITPGTFVTESKNDKPFQQCYWERLDSTGNIIDNNFITSAFRAEVTIDPSDYSFNSTGCGQWTMAGQ